MTKQSVSNERRKHPRFAALSPAMIVGPNGVSGHCLVEDLSAGGARISGIFQLALGESVRLLLQLPGRGPFSLVGQVVRQFAAAGANHPASYGVSFVAAPDAVTGTHDQTVTALRQVHSVDPVVLVVDDSTRTCFSLVKDLHMAGRKAIAVTTALDAIEWLLDGASHIDIALVDVVLGNADGCDLLNFLADEYPQVRRVLMSDSLHMPEVRRVQEDTRPHLVLHKPWSSHQLAQICAGELLNRSA